MNVLSTSSNMNSSEHCIKPIVFIQFTGVYYQVIVNKPHKLKLKHYVAAHGLSKEKIIYRLNRIGVVLH